MKRPTLAIKLNKIAEKLVKKGHPWVFENSIERKTEEAVESGTLCVLFDRNTNKPYAYGLWDDEETIRIKIISREKRLQLGVAFFHHKVAQAKTLRENLLKKVNGFRAIHGENDGFPGIILDIYNSVGVLKIYSKIWFPYIDEVIYAIQEVYELKTIVIRYNRKLSTRKDLPYPEGEIIGEPLVEDAVIFDEYGVQFYAYPVSGHKTGFFLDQRPNRYWVQRHAKGKTILDVFSYVGGFGVHGLKGGAKKLVSVDISQQAMDVAERNLRLNHIDISKWQPRVEDAFEALEDMIQHNLKYDLVILDPPSFAKQSSQIFPALKQYERLAKLGCQLTKKGGFLILGSCSSRVDLEEFKKCHQIAFSKENIQTTLYKVTLHDVDHPITYPEGMYLKTIIYQID